MSTPRINPLPSTPPALAGLINHHGAIYPAVWPDPTVSSDGRHALLVQTDGYGYIAILCDWVEELTEESIVGSSAAVDLLDPDRLARDIVAAYPPGAGALPRAREPAAIVWLREPNEPGVDGPSTTE